MRTLLIYLLEREVGIRLFYIAHISFWVTTTQWLHDLFTVIAKAIDIFT